jgi:hypothetical protein
MNNATAHTRANWRKFLVVAGVFSTPVLYFLYVLRYAVNSLFLDEWNSVTIADAALKGHLTWGLLWQQHNEERILVPNLLFALFTITTHFNTKLIIIFDALLFIAAFLLLVLICRRTPSSSLQVPQTALLGLVWFSLVDFENGLWAFQMAWYIIVFFLMVMLYILLRRRVSRVAFAAAVGAAVAASFSSFQGLLLWPVGFICIIWPLDRGNRRLALAGAWAFVAALTCALYFWNFNFGAAMGNHSEGYDFQHLGALVRYFLADVGNVFPSSSFNSTVIRVHEALGTGLLLGGAAVIYDICRRRGMSENEERVPVAGALVIFGVLFSASIAVGTLWYGMIAAVHTSRFTMPNVIILAALGLYSFSKLRLWRSERGIARPVVVRSRQVLLSVVAIALVTQVVTSARFGIANGQQNHSDRIVAAIIAVDFRSMPHAEAVSLVTTYDYPYFSQFEQLVAMARRDQLGEFAPATLRDYLGRHLPVHLPVPEEG